MQWAGHCKLCFRSGMSLLSYITHPDQLWSLESHAEGWARWVVTVSGLGRPHGTLCMRRQPSSVWTSAGSLVQFPPHSAAPLSTVTQQQQQQQQQWTTWAVPHYGSWWTTSACRLSILLTPLPPLFYLCQLIPESSRSGTPCLSLHNAHCTQFRILWDHGHGPCQCACMMLCRIKHVFLF